MASKTHSRSLPPVPATDTAANGVPPATPFPYGWRYVTHPLPNGRSTLVEVPLTLEDVLHPQEGDVIPESRRHEKERRYLTCVLETRGGRRQGYGVFSDHLVDWGLPGLRPLAPDVTVFDRLRSLPQVTEGTMYVARCGGRCLLAVEIVSPETRDNDMARKPPLYHRAGVQLFAIVDWQGPGHPRELLGFRYQQQRYVPMRLDRQGRLRIATLGVRLGLRDDWLVCYDDATGKELGNCEQLSQERDAAQQERDAAQQERDATRQALQEAEARVRQLEEQFRRRS